MGFEVEVENISNAAAKLGEGKPPEISGLPAPNVGGTSKAGDFKSDYEVWLLTRQEDLDAAHQQVLNLVETIGNAVKSYRGSDADASDVFLKSLDSGFERIDR
ncbi:hypothetical protein ACWEOE_31195 [Amycolatopsis sp. NPDC004368]